ncbi:MAG: hypothetical protein RLZ48_232 [Actinomycetota bacterium]
MNKTAAPDVLLCDLDGVVWLAHEPIPGSVEALRRVEEAGARVLYVTNNSFSTVAEQEAHLSAIGVDAEGKVLTSAMSAASVLVPGQVVLVCGGLGIREEVARAGCEVVVAHENPGARRSYDAVVVGLYREFDYTVLADAQRAVMSGAVLIGSNSDNSYPTPDGVLPGGGSVLAAIATAAGVTPVVTGKPHRPMAELVRRSCPGVQPNAMFMVGDKASTDGAFAGTLGCGFGLVMTGVTTPGTEPDGARTFHDLAAVVEELFG